MGTLFASCWVDIGTNYCSLIDLKEANFILWNVWNSDIPNQFHYIFWFLMTICIPWLMALPPSKHITPSSAFAVICFLIICSQIPFCLPFILRIVITFRVYTAEQDDLPLTRFWLISFYLATKSHLQTLFFYVRSYLYLPSIWT